MDSAKPNLWIFLLLPLTFSQVQSMPSASTTLVNNQPSHHTENGFRNPYLPVQKKPMFKFLYMRAFGDEKWADYQKDAHLVPIVKTNLQLIQNPPYDSFTVTWIGHSTVLVQIAGINILTDPIFSERASPVSWAGPKRVTPSALRISQLPPIHHVVISHNHFDHLDTWTVKQLGNTPEWHATKIFQIKTSAGEIPLKITATPSQHWSKRTLFDTMKTLWASWLIQIQGKKIWFGGDTGYNSIQFKEIGKRYGRIDFAMIPIGAYEPRWFMKEFHVNPEESVHIHNDIQANESMGIHWGWFPLTAEPIMDPTIQLEIAKKKLGITSDSFEFWKIGETRNIH
jgi:N-acyl-phosphatidylethanolamine-hydrolysing phospholipase D